ncbi:MAG: choice-of-anchor Q domain-containing protein, partial [Nannocystaceae bacterium]
RNISIVGLGEGSVYIQGAGDDSVIRIEPSLVTLERVIVTGGESSQGAGIHNMGELALVDASVEGNLASGDGACGGGVYVGENASVLLDSAHIRQNATRNNGLTSDVRGGGACLENGAITLSNNSSVSQNTLELAGTSDTITLGGGIYAMGSVVTVTDASEIANNKLELVENQVSGRGVGGGLALFDSSFELHDGGVIANNRVTGVGTTTTFDLGGGGVFLASSTMTMHGGMMSGNLVSGETDEGVVVRGGGLLLESQSTAQLNGVEFMDNSASALTLGDQLGVSESQADGGAAALYADGSNAVTLEIVDSTIRNNTTLSYGMVPGYTGDADGGAFAVRAQGGNAQATLNLYRSLGHSNWSEADGVVRGGLVSARAQAGNAQVVLNFVNTTITGNTCDGSDGLGGNGGGLFVASSGGQARADVDLSNVTITRNEALGQSTNGGGLYFDRSGVSTQFNSEVRNSIVTNNAAGAGPECYTVGTTFVSMGYNLVKSIAGCSLSGELVGNQIGVDGQLELLLDNGGPTLSHSLLPTSPAIDGGNPQGCLDDQDVPLEVDQRSFPRVEGAACDMGALEQE